MSERAARQCGGKKRHISERKAANEARRLQRNTSVAMKPYFCEFCRGWHVGSVELHERPERELPRRERYGGPCLVIPWHSSAGKTSHQFAELREAVARFDSVSGRRGITTAQCLSRKSA